METNNENIKPTLEVQGRGLGIAGFVISLISLLLLGLIGFFAYAQIVAAGMESLAGTPTSGGYELSVSWLFVCILGLVISIIAMNKLSKTGGKKGLATSGMVIGIISTILTVILIGVVDYGNSQARKRTEQLEDVFKNIDVSKFVKELDSLQKDTDQIVPTDSTSGH
jgi:hypothetical protein